MKEIVLFFASFIYIVVTTKKIQEKKKWMKHELVMENDLIQKQLLDEFLNKRNFN
jgi:hypothetical protein